MSAVFGVSLAAVALLLTVGLAYAVLAAWRRAMHEEGRLPLFALLDRRPAEIREGIGCETLALAARRCAFCGHKQECRAWVASAKSESCPSYCPNAGVF